jgi:nitrous oxide reductase
MKTPFNRRKFLKTSALATAAGMSAPLWHSRVRAAEASFRRV